MAKKKHRAKRSKAIPIAVVAPMAVPVIRAYQQSGSYGAKADRLVRSITGVTIDGGKFNAGDAMPYWMAQGAGIVVHKVAGRVGLNRMISRATAGYFTL